MQKLKARLIVGWRHRETEVRATRYRMRASHTLKTTAVRDAAALKKKI
jgi:hypothetical protein